MPIIEGADLTSIETEFKNFPEGSYRMLVKEVNFYDDKDPVDSPSLANKLRIVSEIQENDVDHEHNSKKFTHFINFRNEDGTLNKYALADIKRYLEAIYGKKSPESNRADTDLIPGHEVTLYLSERPNKDDPDKPYQNVKKILPAS